MNATRNKSNAARKPAEDDVRIPPRERILAVASDLFYRQGIRAVGVDAIAEAAGTNKMTLYRHFKSKDELVAEYLRKLAQAADGIWAELERAHPDDACKQLVAWLKTLGHHINDPKERGCALANAAVELPEKHHPARCVIEKHKQGQRERLVQLCKAAGAAKPDMLADELFLLIEGARVCAQSIGRDGPGTRLARMGETIIASHLK
jgi:AcrR family transcriptional regulator